KPRFSFRTACGRKLRRSKRTRVIPGNPYLGTIHYRWENGFRIPQSVRREEFRDLNKEEFEVMLHHLDHSHLIRYLPIFVPWPGVKAGAMTRNSCKWIKWNVFPQVPSHLLLLHGGARARTVSFSQTESNVVGSR
ncbi:unnamed protein product, partial [Cyprideis torosa]